MKKSKDIEEKAWQCFSERNESIDIQATIEKAQAIIGDDKHMSAATKSMFEIPIAIDRRTLPAGQYHELDYEARQVFDIDISRVVTEYRAQVLEDDSANRYEAPFPEGVTKAVQYGTGIKAHAVYLPQFQLIAYNRVQDYSAESAAICRLVANKALKQVVHRNCCSTVSCRNLKSKSTTFIVNYAE